jgi:hypothetical protein
LLEYLMIARPMGVLAIPVWSGLAGGGTTSG